MNASQTHFAPKFISLQGPVNESVTARHSFGLVGDGEQVLFDVLPVRVVAALEHGSCLVESAQGSLTTLREDSSSGYPDAYLNVMSAVGGMLKDVGERLERAISCIQYRNEAQDAERYLMGCLDLMGKSFPLLYDRLMEVTDETGIAVSRQSALWSCLYLMETAEHVVQASVKGLALGLTR